MECCHVANQIDTTSVACTSRHPNKDPNETSKDLRPSVIRTSATPCHEFRRSRVDRAAES